MSDLPPLPIPQLLRQYGLRPNRRLGQNFLIEPNSIAKVIQAAQIQAGDVVLEIGAGLGSLTRHLAALCQQVVTIELDQAFIPVLQQVLCNYSNVRIIHGDILQIEPTTLFTPSTTSFSVVANIPYYITSAVIRHLLEATLRPKQLTLTLQKEVAQRICAAAGEMSLLALSVQLYGQPKIAAHLPAQAFYPIPKVDSAVIRVELFAEPRIADTATFFLLAKAGFSQKRKTLRNALSGGLRLSPQQAGQLLLAAGIDPNRRAETLSLTEWGELVKSWLALGFQA